MSMNLMQLVDDVVVFISEMDWPEMDSIGYKVDGLVHFGGEEDRTMKLIETSRGTIMVGMFCSGSDPVFKEIQPDEFLIRKIAMEFMAFCSVKHPVEHAPILVV